jgi:hypothetical protein
VAFVLQSPESSATERGHMSYLDWYLRLNKKSREMGYHLCLLICPDPEAVAGNIIPKAVEIACKSARKQSRRDESNRKHWKIHFTDLQLYQIAILEASQNHAKLSGFRSANWLTLYIGFLSLCALQRNSFYVAVGFERILNTGSARDILELYEWLSYRIFPDGPPMGRDEKSANDICKSLHEQIYRQFKDAFQTSGHRLMFDEVPKGNGGISDEIYQILDKMIPWETDHFPNTNRVYAKNYQRIITELSLAHVCIDQQRCLEDVKRNNMHISQSFDTWKIPIPNNAEPVEPSYPLAPRWQDIEEEVMKEILWLEEKSRRCWGSAFEVIVDGEIKDRVQQERAVEISLPPSARYVEIREAESQIMIANCHLMDPGDLPESGWRNSIKVPAGGRINLEFFPDEPENEMAGLRLRVGIVAKQSWLVAIRNRGEQLLQPRARINRGRSLAWVAFAVSLMLALSASFIALYNLKSRVNDLQRENAELRAQASDIPALKNEIAELRQFRTQPPYPAPQEAIYDGSSLVAFDRQGNITGLELMPEEFQQMIKTALVTGRVEAPELRALGRQTPKLMGENIPAEGFKLINPVGIVTETDRPAFRWQPLKGATGYTVSVSDSDYKEVATSKVLSKTGWIIDRPLKRGKTYSWQVVALKGGQEIRSPNAPGVTAKFRVLDQTDADELEQARKIRPTSHLVMGLLYARAGLFDRAEQEFKALFNANPKSSAAQRLLRNVQVLKRAG